MAPKVQFSKAQILEAALDYSKEKGLSNLTVRKLASALGCSVAPIYVNFKNSQELIEAVIVRIKTLVWEYSTKSYTKIGFFNIGIGQVRFVQDYPQLYNDLLLLDPEVFKVDHDQHEKMLDIMSKDSFLEGLSREDNRNLLFKMSQFTSGFCLSILKAWSPLSVDQGLAQMEEMAHQLVFAMRNSNPGQFEPALKAPNS